MLVYNNYHGFTITVLLQGPHYVATIFELGKYQSEIADVLMSPASFGERFAFLCAQRFVDTQTRDKTQH